MYVHRFGHFRFNLTTVSAAPWVVDNADTPCAHVLLVVPPFAETKRVVTHVATVIFLCLLGQMVVWGSVTGSIAGVVRDATGAIIPGVTVTAKCTETGTQEVVRTNTEGLYESMWIRNMAIIAEGRLML